MNFGDARMRSSACSIPGGEILALARLLVILDQRVRRRRPSPDDGTPMVARFAMIRRAHGRSSAAVAGRHTNILAGLGESAACPALNGPSMRSGPDVREERVAGRRARLHRRPDELLVRNRAPARSSFRRNVTPIACCPAVVVNRTPILPATKPSAARLSVDGRPRLAAADSRRLCPPPRQSMHLEPLAVEADLDAARMAPSRTRPASCCRRKSA